MKEQDTKAQYCLTGAREESEERIDRAAGLTNRFRFRSPELSHFLAVDAGLESMFWPTADLAFELREEVELLKFQPEERAGAPVVEKSQRSVDAVERLVEKGMGILSAWLGEGWDIGESTLLYDEDIKLSRMAVDEFKFWMETRCSGNPYVREATDGLDCGELSATP